METAESRRVERHSLPKRAVLRCNRRLPLEVVSVPPWGVQAKARQPLAQDGGEDSTGRVASRPSFLAGRRAARV